MKILQVLNVPEQTGSQVALSVSVKKVVEEEA